MYGMVNNIIKEYIISEIGQAGWEEVKNKSGLEHNEFISMEQYPDEVSGAMVGGYCQISGKPAAKVMEEIGLFFIEFSGRHYDYYEVLEMAGDTLPDLLNNLDDLHIRVAEQFENLRPPSFWCSDVEETSLTLHYASEREGLAPMIVGLVKGLGKMVDVDCTVSQTAFKSEGADHDEFHVTYNPVAKNDLSEESTDAVLS